MSPKILLIDCGEDAEGKALLQSDWESVTEAIKGRAEVTITESAEEIGSSLKEIKPDAVFVQRAGWDSIQPKFISETSTLKAYVENGGRVVYGGLFPAIATNRDMKEIFGEGGYGVGWYYSCYQRAPVRLHREAGIYSNGSLGLQSAKLPEEIPEFTPLTLTVTNPGQVLYGVIPWGEVPRVWAVGTMAPVGKGYVAFWGDRDNVPETVDVITAMLGLPPKPQQ